MPSFSRGISPTEIRVGTESRIIFGNGVSSGGSDKTDTLQSIFGLPPDNILPETNRKILDSMPVCHFFPGIPDFTRGLDLFRIKSAWTENTSGDPSYTRLLKTHGFETPNSFSQGIKVAYLADSFPTDTFTNEYGENFLQGITDVGSEKMHSLAQFMGTKSGIEAFNKLVDPVLLAAERGVKTLPYGEKIAGIARSVGGGAIDLVKAGITSANLTRPLQLIDRLAAGARIDFPMVWKSSGFQPSYTMTVRLYNPNPRSKKDTKKFIAGPIAALMLLAVPITQDGSTYSWPFFHRIHSPGIFDLNPGFISNLTVIKGGDQQQISQQQRLGIVDVRIDVGSLFSTMVSGGPRISQKTRPTVKKYINSMINPIPARHEVYDRKAIKQKDAIAETTKFFAVNTQRSADKQKARQRRAAQPQLKEDPSVEAQDRVALDNKILAARLELQACRGRTSCVAVATEKLNNLLTVANIPAV